MTQNHLDHRLDRRLVDLPDGRPRLSVLSGLAGLTGQPGQPASRPFLLVHGLASNALLWAEVADRLLAAGHPVVAVDQRGHGHSEAPADGYDTDTCADDLAALIAVLGLGRPVVVGQSWGGNVVVSLAARHPETVGAIGCVDGGWIRLSDRFASFEDCWAVLEPPNFEGLTYAALAAGIRSAHPDWPASSLAGTLANLVELSDGGVRARLSRDHHRAIVRSLYEGDPYQLFPEIAVPALLMPATGDPSVPGDPSAPGEQASPSGQAVRRALELLPDGDVRWYPGADHDLHAQHPDRVAEDLLALAGRIVTTEEKP